MNTTTESYKKKQASTTVLVFNKFKELYSAVYGKNYVIPNSEYSKEMKFAKDMANDICCVLRIYEKTPSYENVERCFDIIINYLPDSQQFIKYLRYLNETGGDMTLFRFKTTRWRECISWLDEMFHRALIRKQNEEALNYEPMITHTGESAISIESN
jgi:hypothetical protein